MIEFLTLFLGIVAGPQDVGLLVDEQTTSVELRLDGETLTRIGQPPWEAEIDLGTQLAPHVLEAVGFDAVGAEVARTRQLLNVPRPAAEISLLLHRGEGDRLEAQLAWETASGAAPTERIALLDEKEVPILAGGRVDLSGVDGRQLHVLQIEMWFPDLTSARGHLVFGGEYMDEASAELTAVPTLPSKGSVRVSEMTEWFVSEGEPLRVVAVEKGLASLMIVRGPGVSRGLQSLVGVPKSTPQGQSSGLGGIQGRIDPSTAELQRSALPLGNDIRVRLVVPRALQSFGQQIDFDLFSVSPEIRASQGGLFWILSQDVRVAGAASQTRLNDAVTLAGLQAAGTNHRRATLLIVAEDSEDASRFDVATVKRYLNSLNVPLFVWQLGESSPPRTDWGPSARISSFGDLKRAWRALDKSLNRQRVVWLEGIHLPNAVEIVAGGKIELAVGDNRD
jgi:hypothetical protein